MFVIKSEKPADHSLIEPLLDSAFGAGRLSKISYRYRDGVAPIEALSLTAWIDDMLVGSIRYWPILLNTDTVLLLGPLAIAPHQQKRGIGRALTAQSLDVAERMGYRLVFLVGDPGYYQHLGFVSAPSSIIMPGENPERLQFRSLGEAPLMPEHGQLEPWRQVRGDEPTPIKWSFRLVS